MARHGASEDAWSRGDAVFGRVPAADLDDYVAAVHVPRRTAAQVFGSIEPAGGHPGTVHPPTAPWPDASADVAADARVVELEAELARGRATIAELQEALSAERERAAHLRERVEILEGEREHRLIARERWARLAAAVEATEQAVESLARKRTNRTW